MERNRKLQEKFQLRNHREFSLNDIYKAAEQSRATIYSVVPGFRLLGLTKEDQIAQMRAWNDRLISLPWISRKTREDNKRLPREVMNWEAEDMSNLQSALAVLSTITGGWIDFFDQPSGAADIYSHILSDINERYIVGYYSTNKVHDGKRRKVTIEVRNHPDYMVIGRKSYYASNQNQ